MSSSLINVIIDLSHWNTVDLAKAKSAGVAAVIHKASEGASSKDSLYAERRVVCGNLGLMFGSYHFLTSEDPVEQAQHFLHVVDAADQPTQFLAVDFENELNKPRATLTQLAVFVQYVKREIGRWPVIYGGSDLRALAEGNAGNGWPIISLGLQQCPLWEASYTSHTTGIVGWKGWDLWQYTDDQHGNPPHDVAGICECDRDICRFTTLEDLTAWWANPQPLGT